MKKLLVALAMCLFALPAYANPWTWDFDNQLRPRPYGVVDATMTDVNFGKTTGGAEPFTSWVSVGAGAECFLGIRVTSWNAGDGMNVWVETSRAGGADLEAFKISSNVAVGAAGKATFTLTDTPSFWIRFKWDQTGTQETGDIGDLVISCKQGAYY